MATSIERQSLGDVLIRIARQDGEQLRHLLALTYEFDPEQALNLMLSRELYAPLELTLRRRLAIARLHPLIVYDAAKTRDVSSLPHFLELHPWKSRAFGCHHSKACCLVTDQAVHLFLGSFNLTASGLFHNREVMEYFRWAEDGRPEDGRLIREWAEFLRRCYSPRTHGSERSSLSALIDCLDARLSSLDGDDEYAPRLLISGYGGLKTSAPGAEDDAPRAAAPAERGLDNLRRLWIRWFGESARPSRLCAVSPFFDVSAHPRCAASVFRQAFPSLRSLDICTDARGLTGLSLAHFGGLAPGLRLIPAETSKAERADIERRAAEHGVSVPESATLERKLHAKILLLADDEGHGLCYAGSANFTLNAWLGNNQELGVCRRLNEDADALWKNILKGLYASSKNAADRLPDEPPARVESDPEDNAAPDMFPDFIDFITLETMPDGGAFFRLHFAEPAAGRLEHYAVRWGEGGPALRFDASGAGESMQDGLWQRRLASGRALEFQHLASGRVFFFPFLYADAVLRSDAESLLGISSLDWLLMHQSAEERDAAEPCFAAAAETLVAPVEIERDANPVIAMQHYLRLFGGAERLLRDRMDVVARSRHPDESLKFLILGELSAFARLLLREYARSGRNGDEACLFKLGELRASAAALREAARRLHCPHARAPLAVDALFHPLLGELDAVLSAVEHPSPLLRDYLDFILREPGHD